MSSNRLLIIDGNSIMNRAFYGTMHAKTMMSVDGKYTNALYGFLSILFKELEELDPEYIAVAFDLKAPTHRHKMYDGYKGTRHAMPEELAQQMPVIKEILKDMNIAVIEKEGYEADDIIGTMSKEAEKEGHLVTILSGDRDTFQLVSENITVRIPRTKMGKTEVDDYTEEKIEEEYGLKPKALIEVKGLMGDTSDNIPGVPGVGEKTAIKLVKDFGTVEKLYEKVESGESGLKGALKEKIENNKDLAMLSKTLGTILLDAKLDIKVDELKLKEWNKEEVLKKFKELRFNRFIDRFSLSDGENKSGETSIKKLFEIEEIDINDKDFSSKVENIIEEIKQSKEIIYYFEKKNINIADENKFKIVDEELQSVAIYNEEENKIIYIKNFVLDNNTKENANAKMILDLFEDEEISKVSYKAKHDYIILKEVGIDYKNLKYDAEIAGYNLNPTDKNTIESMASKYLNIDFEEYLEKSNKEDLKQMNLFDMQLSIDKKSSEIQEKEKMKSCMICYTIAKLRDITIKKLEEERSLALFNNIEMPLVLVLAQMQYSGMYVNDKELKDFGEELKESVEKLTSDIYELAGEEFNINSHQQLGKILFEKLKLPAPKKTKTGYSTDVDVLEKLINEHEIIEKILNYRKIAKLNSTYIEGLIPCINKYTHKIHSKFHQTITATGRISSTDPNLQNIPTREEIGKQIRKAFLPEAGNIYIDADYSQIELRVLAHISKDENMIYAFNHGEDIHRQAASKVFNIPIDEVTKEQRSSAKAVNFGIVYGISDFGLANQIKVSNKKAKQYINDYLEKYSGIKNFMDNIIEDAKEKGYVETLFGRRRYIPELKSSNYMVRKFGDRVAMNTPIQGTAADIMKIAMINVNKELKENKIDGKIVLQIHDELLLEVKEEQKEIAKEILKRNMENAMKLDVPLEVELSEGKNWYEVK